MSSHRFVAQSSLELVRKVAIDYLRYGYCHYAVRQIPEGKNLEVIGRKLMDCYDITGCRTKRSRRRAKGLANVVFVRCGLTFVLLATDGHHHTFSKITSCDVRDTPLYWDSYSIGMRAGKPEVRVRAQVWTGIERRFSIIGLHEHSDVQRKLDTLPYPRFPGIIRQRRKLVADINARRKRAGLLLLELPRFTQSQPIVREKIGEAERELLQSPQ